MNRKEYLINHLLKRGYRHIEDDIYDISKRVSEYDEDLILFFNPRRQRYEIHSCTFFPSARPTYCVGSNRLDAELIYTLRMADNRTEYGFKEKMKDIDKGYDLKEERENKAVEIIQKEVKKDTKQRLKMKQHFSMG